MSEKFVHLHVHTHYSLLDGLGKPKDYVKKAQEQGSPAIAITDHGNMYGAIEFYKETKMADLKSIIGCEFYVARGSHTEKNPQVDKKRYHLILLAENQEGYENLLELSTKAYLDGLYYKPRIDWNLMEQYSKGLIATTACIAGEVPQAILDNDETKARKLIKRFQKTYGKENFFFEVQHHPNLEGQNLVNRKLIELGQELKIPLIATNDCHYVNEEDKFSQDVLICIQTNKTINEENRMSMMDGNYSLRSPENMATHFQETPEAISNTVEIANRCNVDFEFGKNLIPVFKVPEEEKKLSPREYLRKKCQKGLKIRYGTKAQEKEIIERLEYELSIIEKMEFESYFLIVWDYVKWAKENGILVGPGRGSGAGSIIAYALTITDLDPLKYDLLFERFLNPERISMPDFDIDFADDKRDQVINYVREKYGEDHVAQISTFGTLAAKAAVKDTGRALGIPFAEMNALSKLIPDRPGTKLKEALETENELKEAYNSSPEYKQVFDTALLLEGVVRHISVHACAVVISDDKLTKYTALQHPPKDDTTIISQYSAKPLESLGLLKMDFLGLKNLTILQTAINIIKRTHGKNIELEKIPMDDVKAFELLQNAQTTGVFQLESAGMKRYLKELKPTEFEDIIAMVSLYRPGPMEWIPTYINGKHGKIEVNYPHESLKPILEKTYGIAIYQEQILQIAQVFAGFSLGAADILRRAIGKKIISELKAQRAKFIAGAKSLGHTQKMAEYIFDKVIEPFAGYGFNKSHAACYALIAYQTAFLKAHYPTEFMAALLTSDHGNSDRIALEIAECKQMGINVLPPDINESLANFTVVKSKNIRFGFSAIKGVGDATVSAIKEARGPEEIKFADIEDFSKRVNHRALNKKVMEALAKAGAFDSLEERNKVLNGHELILSHAKDCQEKVAENQMDLFGGLPQTSFRLELPHVKPAKKTLRLTWEKDLLGFYVSEHPLEGLGKYWQKHFDLIYQLKDGDSAKISGIVNTMRRITTKKGDIMLILTIEDPSGNLEVTIFPRTYKEYGEQIEEDKAFTFAGNVNTRNEELQLIANKLEPLNLDATLTKVKAAQMYGDFEREIEEDLPEKNQSVSLDFSTQLKEKVSNNPLVIKIISQNSPDIKNKLFKLKELLENNIGTQKVILEIDGHIRKTNIQVNNSTELQNKIELILN